MQPYEPIDRHVISLQTADLINSIPTNDAEAVFRISEQMTDVYRPDELQNLIGIIRAYSMSAWESFSDSQRELLARYLEDYLRQNSGNPPQGFKEGGKVHKFPSVDQMKYELMMRRA